MGLSSCRINGKTAKEFLYLNVLTVYLLFQVLDYTVLKASDTYGTVAEYVRYLCYAVVIVIVLLDIYNGRSVGWVVVTSILVGLMVLSVNFRTPLFYLLMIIAAKDVNLRKIIYRASLVLGVVLAVFVIGSQIGLVDNYLFGVATRERVGLGFIWASHAPTMFLFFIMCWIYLRRERMRIYEFAILEAINIWFYYKTDTRISFYFSTILLVYVFFMRYFWQNRTDRIRKNRWLIVAPTVCCVGGILLHLCYNADSEQWVELNTILSERLAYGADAFSKYGLTLFGQEIKWVGYGSLVGGGTYNYVDCSYLQILVNYGVIFLILVVAAYTFLMYMAVRTKDFYLQSILLFIVVSSILEPRLVNLAFNPFLLLTASAWSLRSVELLNARERFFARPVRFRGVKIALKHRE